MIGADAMINERVYISDTHTRLVLIPPSSLRDLFMGSIEIGDGVWIGEGPIYTAILLSVNVPS